MQVLCQGKRLGVPRNSLTPNNDATAAPIIPVLEAAGAIIVEDTNFTGVSCPHLMQFISTIAIFTFPFFQTFLTEVRKLRVLLIQFLLFHWLCIPQI
jgi:hypothetical protein